MAIDDNTSYELTGAQVKDLANKIKAKAADNTFVGATSAIPGSKGLVPAPQAADDTKFLSGDGTWKTVSGGATYTAGTNIQISAQNVISATDTTYSAFTGATSSVAGASGLVPAPTTSDVDKYLKGDGTWAAAGGGSSATTFYWKVGVGANAGLYKDSGMTTAATLLDVTTAMADGVVYVYLPQSGVYETAITKRDSFPFFTTVFGSTTNSEELKSARYSNSGSVWTRAVVTVQNELTAGSNITISSNTISATDTTYSNFTGATTLQAGAAGLVPAPTTSDPDKFLKGDGTWSDPDTAVITMTSTDPGEGVALAANHFIAVYEP